MAGLLADVLTPLTGLPLYVVGLVLLGIWVFFRGRAVLVLPPARIDLKVRAGEMNDLAEAINPREEISLPRPVQTTEDQAQQVEDGRLEDAVEDGAEDEVLEASADEAKGNEALDEVGAAPVRVGPEPDRGEGYRRFPLHDAPLWLMAWMGLLLLTTVLLIADGLLQLNGGPGYPLEELALSWLPLVGDRIPLQRPTIALFAYTLVGYAALELGVFAVTRALALKRLHLMHPQDRRRRMARWLYRLFGFHEFRTLDYSFPRWLFPVSVIVVGGLLAGDMLLFYADAPGWAGPLAVAHLLPVVLARVFDYAWLTEVSWTRRTEALRDRVDIHELPDRLAEEELVYADADTTAVRVDLQAGGVGHQRGFGDEDGDLPLELLLALTGSERWYAHQARAWDELRKGRNVVLSLPNDAGRSVWAWLAAVRKVVLESGGVLVLYPDADSARRASRRLARALAGTSLWWNLEVHDATAPEFASLDLESETPFLIFSDLDTFGEEMLIHWSRHRPFWRLLRLIVLEDVDRMSGVRASNLYYLLRRLKTLRKRDTATDIQYAATSFPLGASLLPGLEELVGAEFVRVESDTAPRAPVQLCFWVPPTVEESARRRFAPGAPLPEILRTAARIRQMGHDPVWLEPSALTRDEQLREEELGVYDEFDDLQMDLRLSGAQVSICYAGGAEAWRLPVALAHAGARVRREGRTERPGPDEPDLHVSLVVLKPDPLALLLLRSLEERATGEVELEPLTRPGVFAFSRENRLLQRRHLLASLRETAMGREELVALFGEALVQRELQRLADEHRLERLGPPGEPGRERYRLREGVREESVEALVVSDQAVRVVSPALGRDRRGRDRELFQVDSARFHTALYPGKVLVHGGLRYRVPVRALPGTVSGRRLVVAREIREVITTKIRTWHLRPTPEPRPGESVECRLGEQPFVFEVGWYRMRERIHGYREWTNDTLVSLGSLLYRNTGHLGAVEGAMDVPVLTVRFPGADLSGGAERLLTHVLRQVLSFRFANEPATPDLLERESWLGEDGGTDPYDGGPGFVVADVFPDGVGYVERTTPDDVVAMLRFGQDLLERVGHDRPDLLLGGVCCFSEEGGDPRCQSPGPLLPGGAVPPVSPTADLASTAPALPAAGTPDATDLVLELERFLDRVVPPAGRVPQVALQRLAAAGGGADDLAAGPSEPELEAALKVAREVSQVKVQRSRR